MSSQNSLSPNIHFQKQQTVLIEEEYKKPASSRESEYQIIEMSSSQRLEQQEEEEAEDDENDKYLALDCEMVGVGPNGKKSALARVSIVDYYCNIVLDKFVKPEEEVTDYRTLFSGITKELLIDAEDFSTVQAEVRDTINDRTVIGHAIDYDFHVLKLTHPRELTRDSAVYKRFTDAVSPGTSPPLKKLAKRYLDITIQDGQHDSVEDASAAMLLYRRYQNEWEAWIDRVGAETPFLLRPVGCYQCGSLDHISRDCPQRSAGCYQCQSTHHILRDCPHRTRRKRY